MKYKAIGHTEIQSTKPHFWICLQHNFSTPNYRSRGDSMEQATEVQLQASQASLFEKLESYPFNTDPEFANGLSIILGHPDFPASETEVNRDDDLVLQAKCFYFSRYVTFCIMLIRD